MKAAKRNIHSNYNLHADLMKIKKAFANATKDVTGRTGDMIYDVKGRTGELFQDSLQRVKDKSAGLQDVVVAYTHEKPLKTVGLAMLAGVVIGYIIHRK